MAKRTLSEIGAYWTGYSDAYTACDESGDASTPDGGWDSWFVEGVGFTEACRIMEENPEHNREDWSESMQRKLAEYHNGAVNGARAWEAEDASKII